MHSSSQPITPTPPPDASKGTPPAAEHAAKRVGWGGWLAFWVQLITAAVMVVLLALTIMGRSVEEGDRTLWVGLSIVLAIASLIALLIGTYFAFRLTRTARQLLRPDPTPTPPPSTVQTQVSRALIVSITGLGIGLLGTEVSTLSLLAKALSNPQGAALATSESVLRGLDVLIILVNSGLALAHFCGQMTHYVVLRQVSNIHP
jgi:heme/copper-type cytochrome/quinol oxidase subunit 2